MADYNVRVTLEILNGSGSTSAPIRYCVGVEPLLNFEGTLEDLLRLSWAIDMALGYARQRLDLELPTAPTW